MSEVIHNEAKQRFELAVGDQLALADYRLSGNAVHITHVETPEALRGQGVAGKLMEGVVRLVRAKGQKIVPVCPYAVTWLKRHKEHQDLLA